MPDHCHGLAPSLASMNGTSNSSLIEQAELVAKAAKDAFDAAQRLDNAAAERVKALALVKEALTAAKGEILAANANDMDVCIRHLEALFLAQLGRLDCSQTS